MELASAAGRRHILFTFSRYPLNIADAAGVRRCWRDSSMASYGAAALHVAWWAARLCCAGVGGARAQSAGFNAVFTCWQLCSGRCFRLGITAACGNASCRVILWRVRRQNLLVYADATPRKRTARTAAAQIWRFYGISTVLRMALHNARVRFIRCLPSATGGRKAASGTTPAPRALGAQRF